MVFETIRAEAIGMVGVVTLDRPERLNPWSLEVVKEVRSAFETFMSDPAIGAIVLTGAGRAFCCGADVRTMKDRQDDPVARKEAARESALQYRGPDSWTHFIHASPKPTIVAFNGLAVGVGATLSLPFDIRIASDTAEFSFAFVRVGVGPELGSSALLPRLVGEGRAIEWCMTARRVPAAEGREAGLVSEVIPASRLVERAVEIGEMAGGFSPPAIRNVRQIIRQNAMEPDLQKVLDREAEALVQLHRTPEYRESVLAFLEKRKPDFRPSVGPDRPPAATP